MLFHRRKPGGSQACLTASRIAGWRERGFSLKQVRKLARVSTETLRFSGLIGAAELRRGPKAKILPIAEIAERYRLGESLNGLIGIYHVSFKRLAHELREAGVVFRGYDPAIPDSDVERVRDLAKSGLRQAEIGELYGTSQSNVSDFMRKHDIPTYNARGRRTRAQRRRI